MIVDKGNRIFEKIRRDFIETRGDLRQFFYWARENRVTPLYYWLLRDVAGRIKLPQWFVADLKKHYHETLIRNQLLLNEGEKILAILKTNSIPVIPLKGLHLASCIYPDPALRPFSDIDLLIRKDSLSKVTRIMKLQGYCRSPELRTGFDEKFTSCISFYKETAYFPVVIEIHWHLLYFPTLAPFIDINDLWLNARWSKMNGWQALTLKPEHQIIYLCLHYYLHAAAYFIWLIDIALAIEKFHKSIDWNELIETTKRFKIDGAVGAGLMEANKVFNLNLPKISETIKWQKFDFRNFAMSITGRNRENTGVTSLLNLFFISKMTDKIRFLIATILPVSKSGKSKNRGQVFGKLIGASSEILKYLSANAKSKIYGTNRKF